MRLDCARLLLVGDSLSDKARSTPARVGQSTESIVCREETGFGSKAYYYCERTSSVLTRRLTPGTLLATVSAFSFCSPYSTVPLR